MVVDIVCGFSFTVNRNINENDKNYCVIFTCIARPHVTPPPPLPFFPFVTHPPFIILYPRVRPHQYLHSPVPHQSSLQGVDCCVLFLGGGRLGGTLIPANCATKHVTTTSCSVTLKRDVLFRGIVWRNHLPLPVSRRYENDP